MAKQYNYSLKHVSVFKYLGSGLSHETEKYKN